MLMSWNSNKHKKTFGRPFVESFIEIGLAVSAFWYERTDKQSDRHTDRQIGVFGSERSNTFSQWKWLNVTKNTHLKRPGPSAFLVLAPRDFVRRVSILSANVLFIPWHLALKVVYWHSNITVFSIRWRIFRFLLVLALMKQEIKTVPAVGFEPMIFLPKFWCSTDWAN